MNSKLFSVLVHATEESVYDAISPAMLVIATSSDPHEHLTAKIKLLSIITEGLQRVLAALMVEEVHRKLDTLEPPAQKEKDGKNLIQNLSPEVCLFAALFIHFEGQGDGFPSTKALAMLKTLGHEIPEKLIPGVVQ